MARASSAAVHSELLSVQSAAPRPSSPSSAPTALSQGHDQPKRRTALASRWEGFSDRTFSLFSPDAPPLYKARDKATYTVAVANVVLLAFLTGGHSYVMPWYYSVLFPMLFVCRIIVFSHRHWGYFLVDFCYFVNVALLLYVILGGPQRLLVVLFALAHGPLGAATVLFRNSLVFHSVDYVTSCYIHVAPMLVTFAIRWYAFPGARFWVVSYDIEQEALGPEGLLHTFAIPMLAYLAWGCVYVAFATCLCPVPQDDMSYLTIFRYLVVNEKGMLHGLAEYRGGRYAPALYGTLNVLFTAATLLPTILFYNYIWLNWLYLGAISLATIHNGGSYYIDIFSRKYVEDLSRLGSSKATVVVETRSSIHRTTRELDEEEVPGAEGICTQG